MIRLLSTDFDGTLVDHDSKPAVSPDLYEMLAQLQRCGVSWAVNTGRDLNFILQGLREFEFPFEPDYILTNEREIFHRNPDGKWQDYGDWNRRCIEAHESLFSNESSFLDEVLGYIRQETRSELIYENSRPVGIVAADDAEVDRLITFVHDRRGPDSLFHYQRNTIFLRFCHAHYSKGTALAELCRLTDIGGHETFSVGDHHNDLSMLDGRFARWAAAPANAIDEVKETVRKAGGYVAEKRCSEGVVEALRHFFETHSLTPAGFPLVK
jgi:HAD superfamily hydrolase (TIGR01484 family)